MEVKTMSFVDVDGQEYQTVKMPDGKFWMVPNFNRKADGSYCYDNFAPNGEKYGLLYTWRAAKELCPNGCHLPTKEEWESLIAAVGGLEIAGKKLKSKSDWDLDGKGEFDGNGTDEFGFSALPGGFRYPILDGCYCVRGTGSWWTATERNDNGQVYCVSIGAKSDDAAVISQNKEWGFSVRYIQD